MSGGSFDYLCYKDWPDIAEYGHQLRQMSDFLAALGYAQDAAAETEEVIVMLRQFENRINVRLNRLQEVWRAAEWWQSCDSSEDTFKATLEKYRETP